MIFISIPGNPVPFARARSNGKRRFTPPKQEAFMAEVAMRARRVMGADDLMTGPLVMRARFTFAIPASWPKAKRDAALWHTSVPDADNCVKICADALKLIVWRDDAQVAKIEAEKRYGAIPSTVIEISRLDEVAA